MKNNLSPQNDSVQKNVLDKIRTGEVQMKPKIYFVGKVVLLVIIATLILIITSFVFSFILFSISVSGRLLLLGFGRQGLLAFVVLFPWVPVIIDILLILVLEQLLKRFKFGYRSSMAYLVIGILVLTAFIGFLISISPLHTILEHRAEQHRLPVFGSMYEHVHRPPEDHGIFRGYVNSIESQSVTLRPDEELATSTLIRVFLPQAFLTDNFLHIGDYIFVAGRLENGEVHAFGVRKIEPPQAPTN